MVFYEKFFIDLLSYYEYNNFPETKPAKFRELMECIAENWYVMNDSTTNELVKIIVHNSMEKMYYSMKRSCNDYYNMVVDTKNDLESLSVMTNPRSKLTQKTIFEAINDCNKRIEYVE